MARYSYVSLICLSGVQCAAVNVICELARKNPKNYLSLAPTFFKLMTNSSNNWMLIKIIKLVSNPMPLATVIRGIQISVIRNPNKLL